MKLVVSDFFQPACKNLHNKAQHVRNQRMKRSTLAALIYFFILSSASANQTSYLLCESRNFPNGDRWNIVNIPVYFDDQNIVAIGNRAHCVSEPLYLISETHAAWKCVTGMDATGAAVKSVYVQIHRYTGRFHRNDLSGHYDDLKIEEIWHGTCTVHSAPQF